MEWKFRIKQHIARNSTYPLNITSLPQILNYFVKYSTVLQWVMELPCEVTVHYHASFTNAY
jgi:hypothetical protein